MDLKSYLLSLVVTVALQKGLPWIEKQEQTHEAEIEAFVKKAVPGTMFDEMAWGAIKGLVPKVLAAAKAYLQKLGGRPAGLDAGEISMLMHEVLAQLPAAPAAEVGASLACADAAPANA